MKGGKMEYKVIKLKSTKEETEKELNKLSKKGWKFIGSYAYDNSHLILGR